MARWGRTVHGEQIRYRNSDFPPDGTAPDWVLTDDSSINCNAVRAVEVRQDLRGLYAYVFYSPDSEHAGKPDLTLQLEAAERLVRALERRIQVDPAPPSIH